MKSRICAVAILSLVAAASTRAEIIEQILVKVNGEIFTKSDLETRQIATLRQKGQQIDLKSDPSNQQLRKALDEITPAIMVDAVDEMLIVSTSVTSCRPICSPATSAFAKSSRYDTEAGVFPTSE